MRDAALQVNVRDANLKPFVYLYQTHKSHGVLSLPTPAMNLNSLLKNPFRGADRKQTEGAGRDQLRAALICCYNHCNQFLTSCLSVMVIFLFPFSPLSLPRAGYIPTQPMKESAVGLSVLMKKYDEREAADNGSPSHCTLCQRTALRGILCCSARFILSHLMKFILS